MNKDLYSKFDTRQYMHAKDFEVFYYKDAKLNHVSPHIHDHYELYFFIEGYVDYQIEDSSYHLEYGDYLLIPPNVPHHPIFKSHDIPYRRFVLWISAEYYHKLTQISSDFSYSFDYVIAHQAYHFRTDYIVHQTVQGCLLELLEDLNGTAPFKKTNSSLLLASLIIELNRITYGKLHQVSPSYQNVLYLNICDYINNHLGEDLSLDALSKFFYVSKYHISHIFKENMGISLHQYILKKRIHASKNSVLSGESLSKIYNEYGFKDYTSFYRAFKKEYGLSPKEFKEQHQALETIYNPY